jgi:CheY-like chemotaxis protein
MDFHLKKDKGSGCTALDFLPEIRNTSPKIPIILISASLQDKPRQAGMYDHFLEIDAAFWDRVLPLVQTCLEKKSKTLEEAQPSG